MTLLVYIQVLINRSKDILITICIWIKGTISSQKWAIVACIYPIGFIVVKTFVKQNGWERIIKNLHLKFCCHSPNAWTSSPLMFLLLVFWVFSLFHVFSPFRLYFKAIVWSNNCGWEFRKLVVCIMLLFAKG
jgi:hypothetical protein